MGEVVGKCFDELASPSGETAVELVFEIVVRDGFNEVAAGFNL